MKFILISLLAATPAFAATSAPGVGAPSYSTMPAGRSVVQPAAPGSGITNSTTQGIPAGALNNNSALQPGSPTGWTAGTTPPPNPMPTAFPSSTY
jgi:hypothetical protein